MPIPKVRDDVFHAIAHPLRRDILKALAEGEQPAMSLMQNYEISAAGLSQHLKVLRAASLVDEFRRGKERIYFLTPEPLAEVRDYMDFFARFWQDKLGNLDTYLRSKHGEPTDHGS